MPPGHAGLGMRLPCSQPCASRPCQSGNEATLQPACWSGNEDILQLALLPGHASLGTKLAAASMLAWLKNYVCISTPDPLGEHSQQNVTLFLSLLPQAWSLAGGTHTHTHTTSTSGAAGRELYGAFLASLLFAECQMHGSISELNQTYVQV